MGKGIHGIAGSAQAFAGKLFFFRKLTFIILIDFHESFLLIFRNLRYDWNCLLYAWLGRRSSASFMRSRFGAILCRRMPHRYVNI